MSRRQVRRGLMACRCILRPFDFRFVASTIDSQWSYPVCQTLSEIHLAEGLARQIAATAVIGSIERVRDSPRGTGGAVIFAGIGEDRWLTE